jgi:hypothetical protein
MPPEDSADMLAIPQFEAVEVSGITLKAVNFFGAGSVLRRSNRRNPSPL